MKSWKRMRSGDPPGLQNRRTASSRCRRCVRLTHASANLKDLGRLACRFRADPTKREADSDYRLPDDPEFAIRINQAAPKGMPRKLAEFVAVAGVAQRITSSVGNY